VVRIMMFIKLKLGSFDVVVFTDCVVRIIQHQGQNIKVLYFTSIF